MPKDHIDMSRNGEYLANMENNGENDASDSQQEVIEILTDDEEDNRESSFGSNNITNSEEPLIVREHNDDDDIQITGASTMNSNERAPRIIRRRNNAALMDQSRNVRRRHNDDEDEIQIIDERPAERQLIPPVDMLPSYASDSLRRRVQGIETPIGVFQSNENSSTSFSGSESERGLRYTETPRRNPLRSRRARRMRPPRNDFVALDHFVLSQQLYHNLYGNWNGHEDLPNADAVEGSVMARIERDNENAVDQRLQNENIFNRAALKNKKEIAEKELPGYTNDIKPESNICCDLCGIILGEGIPNDFKPDVYYNEEENFKKFCEDYKVQAPWFCIRQCLPVDIDLSKRVFVAKCGHIYCGRCVKNIGNRPSGRRKQNQKLTIDNPLVYAPRKCTNFECNLSFTGKKSFTELYF